MIDEVELQFKRLDANLPLPSYAHEGDAGMDLFAAEDAELKPGQRAAVPTGIAVAIPAGYAGYVQPRSGLALRSGAGIVNSPGLVDSGYRGEIKVIVINHDPNDVLHLSKGERIAQLVVLPIPKVSLREVQDLPPSERGTGGFGSTG